MFFGHFGGILYFSFFWAQDFCKKVVLHGGFFFRVSIFDFVTICRKGCKIESITVRVFSCMYLIIARVIETKVVRELHNWRVRSLNIGSGSFGNLLVQRIGFLRNFHFSAENISFKIKKNVNSGVNVHFALCAWKF